MKINKAFSILAACSIAFVSLAKGQTIGNGQPPFNPNAAMFPVVSPTCEFDQMTYTELLNYVAVNNPDLFNLAIILTFLGLSDSSIRLVLVNELCGPGPADAPSVPPPFAFVN